MHAVSTYVSSHYLQAAVTYSQRSTTICTVTQIEAHQLLKKTITFTVDAGKALCHWEAFCSNTLFSDWNQVKKEAANPPLSKR